MRKINFELNSHYADSKEYRVLLLFHLSSYFTTFRGILKSIFLKKGAKNRGSTKLSENLPTASEI